jgi:hypothetical protein
MQAFEESATGAGTDFIKVRILTLGRSFGKVVQGVMGAGRIKVAVGCGAERVQAERRGKGGEGQLHHVLSLAFFFRLLFWSWEFIAP